MSNLAIAIPMFKSRFIKNKITVYDNFHRDTLSNSIYASHPNITIVKGDVLDKEFLINSMQGAQIVIHAAGIAGIDTVIKDPVKTMRVNMIGTANALEAAHINNITDKYYLRFKK